MHRAILPACDRDCCSNQGPQPASSAPLLVACAPQPPLQVGYVLGLLEQDVRAAADEAGPHGLLPLLRLFELAQVAFKALVFSQDTGE